MPEDGGISGVL